MIISLVAFALAGLILPSLTARFGPRMFAFAALVPAAVFVWLLFQVPAVTRGETPTEIHAWVPQLELALAFRLDALSLTMALVVTGVGALVLLYCARYFSSRRSRPRSLRRAALRLRRHDVRPRRPPTTSRHVHVLGDHERALLPAHRALHRSQGESRCRAPGAAGDHLRRARHARGRRHAVRARRRAPRSPPIVERPPDRPRSITVAILLILVGAISKSALVPFHFWLPAAMAAPTPVSAYLHAAAMVKAGIYLSRDSLPVTPTPPAGTRCSSVWASSPWSLGAWRSLRQYDLKLRPGLRDGEPARLPHGRLGVRHPRFGLGRRRAPAGPRALQGGALPRRRHHRPPRWDP